MYRLHTMPSWQEQMAEVKDEDDTMHSTVSLECKEAEINLGRDEIIEPKKEQLSDADSLESMYQFLEHCKDSQSELSEVIKNEPIEDEDNRMHSTISVECKKEEINVTKEGIIEPEAAQSSAANQLESIGKLPQHRKDSQSELSEVVKNEPIEDEEPNIEYSDDTTIQSIISVTKVEVLPIEAEEQKVKMKCAQHKCHLCNKSFKMLGFLRRHLKLHKTKKKDKKDKSSPSSSLDRITPGEDKPYECPYCPLRFGSKQIVTQHKQIHEGVKGEACDICGKKMRKKDLNKHKLTHSKEKLHKCDLCEKRFISIQRLRLHTRLHTGEKRFKCKYCGRAYVSHNSLRPHLRTHLGENIYRCAFCPLAFPLASERRVHLLSHKNEDPETRERNIKALQEDEAKLRLQISREKMQQSPAAEVKERIRAGEKKPYECPYCPRRFRFKYNVTRHKELHEGVKKETCDICGKKMSKNSLKTHKLRHSEGKSHKCDDCGKSFADIHALRRHTRYRSGEKPYKCKYCEWAYTTFSSLNRHLRTHLGDNIYRCELCPLAFPLASERRLHLVSHKNEDPETRERNIKALKEDEAKLWLQISKETTQQPSTEESDQQLKNRIRCGENKPYECAYCPLRFCSKIKMIQHKQIHEDVKRVACDICGKKMRKDYLSDHKLRVHEGKSHKCDVCEKRFITIKRLRIHSRQHTGEKPCKCKYCECCYASYTALKKHLRTHLGDNIYRCEFCPLAFRLAAEHRLHLLSHKNEDPERRERNIKALQEDEAKLRLQISEEKTQQPSTEESDQQLQDRIRRGEKKPYQCPYCPLRFSTLFNMKQHKEIHEGVKREACDICGKTVRKNHLNKHKLTHSKEKLHKCDFCEKRFINIELLRCHSRQHTGEKPFKCKYCGRAYASHTALRAHLRTHLGDNIYRCKFCPLAFPLASERRLHLVSHINEDPETRERNVKALQEVEAKLMLRISEEKTQQPKEKNQPPKEETQQPKEETQQPKEETRQPSTEASEEKDRIIRGEDKPYECPYCPLRFCTLFNMNSHKQIHEGVKREACDICGKTMRKNHLNKHKLTHSKEKLHKCDLCEKRFISIQRLRLHTRLHTGEKPFKCKYCGRAYASHNALMPHLRTHLGDNIYRCKFCPLAFSLASERRVHLVSHKNEDPDTRERNVKALQEVEAKLVLQISKEKTQQPKEETQQPKEETQQRKEETRQPSTEASEEKDRIIRGEDKPYECPYCPLRFCTLFNMNSHKQIHEGVKREACDICGKTMRKNHLNKHKLTHSKEKLHKCDFCEKRFISIQRLRLHTRLHTGEKPFKCKYCGRAYATQNALMPHLRTHLGDNIYRCKFCPLAFSLASERRVHLVSHKNEDPDTRERNVKALQEVEAKLILQISKEKTQQPPSTEDIVQQLKVEPTE